jgi:hypothetical protein
VPALAALLAVSLLLGGGDDARDTHLGPTCKAAVRLDLAASTVVNGIADYSAELETDRDGERAFYTLFAAELGKWTEQVHTAAADPALAAPQPPAVELNRLRPPLDTLDAEEDRASEAITVLGKRLVKRRPTPSDAVFVERQERLVNGAMASFHRAFQPVCGFSLAGVHE